jgi:hypothetical protein
MADGKKKLCQSIANSLVEFGYPDVTGPMIEECWDAYEAGKDELPHGVVGMFAERQLDEVSERRPDILTRGAS